MMSFDQELEAIERRLNALSASYISGNDTNAKLLALQQRLLQIEAALPKWMQTFTLTRKQIQGLKKENLAVIQWTSKLSKLARTHYELFSRHSDQAFWLNLMIERISQSNQSANDEEFDELVNLVLKISEISEIEESFNQELRNLDKIQQRLAKEYAQLGIADANWDASGTMQARLCDKNETAFENAPSRGLSQLFKSIRAHFSWHTNDHLRNEERRLQRLSDRLAQTGKSFSSMISENKADQDESERLAKMIEELSSFEQVFSEQFTQFTETLPKDHHPTIRRVD